MAIDTFKGVETDSGWMWTTSIEISRIIVCMEVPVLFPASFGLSKTAQGLDSSSICRLNSHDACDACQQEGPTLSDCEYEARG